MFPGTAETFIRNAVPLEGALDALKELKDLGVEVSAAGTIAHGAEPRLDLLDNFKPIVGLQGLLTKELDEKARESELARLRANGRLRCIARLQSAAGGAGVWVEASPTSTSRRLRDVRAGERYWSGSLLPTLRRHQPPTAVAQHTADGR